MKKTIGLLHPGNMGITVAATLRAGGHEVLWTSSGRSERTRARAAQAGLIDAGTLADLIGRSAIIVSVCPPEAADAVADEVAALGFAGIYVDANAIQPERARAMAARLEAKGMAFVDGGIIGPAVVKPNTTWLYLSGARAAEVSACFSTGPMQAPVIGAEPGQASGLKMCFAAYNKGRGALLAATMAAAEHFGVRQIVYEQWAHRESFSIDEAERFVTGFAPRAWRFVAEMREIAATFEDAGLPGEFHQGAAEVYEKLRGFKDADPPSIDEVLSALSKRA